MDLLAEEYGRVGDVAGVDRCDARAVEMRSEETRVTYHCRLAEGMAGAVVEV